MTVAETVERIAKASGMWDGRGMPSLQRSVSREKPWSFSHARRGVLVLAWAGSYRLTVDHATALLALLCLTRTEALTSPAMDSEVAARAWGKAWCLSGTAVIERVGSCEFCRPTPTIDVRDGMAVDCECVRVVACVTRTVAVKIGRCPACDGSKCEEICVSVDDACDEEIEQRLLDLGWTFLCPGSSDEVEDGYWYSRPCQTCRGLGERWSEVGRLVLEAMPRPREILTRPAKFGRAKCYGCGDHIAMTSSGLIRSHTGPGPGPRCSGSKLPPDTEARDALAVWSDERMAEGDHLGEWLAQWLAGRDEWIADAQAQSLESMI